MISAARIILAFLLLCGSAIAEKPLAKITGPTSGKPGDLIVLDSKDSVGTHRTWRCWIDLAGPGEQKAEALERWATALRDAGWSVTSPAKGEEQWIEVDGGSKLILPSYPGTYRAALAVGNPDGVDLALWTVAIAASPPKPPDGPDPPDEPDPPPATPQFGLTAAVPTWLAMVPADLRSQKTAIRAAYKSVADKAATFATVADIESAAGGALREAYQQGGFDKDAWKPFGERFNAAFAGLKASGKITTAKEYGLALTELVEALK